MKAKRAMPPGAGSTIRPLSGRLPPDWLDRLGSLHADLERAARYAAEHRDPPDERPPD